MIEKLFMAIAIILAMLVMLWLNVKILLLAVALWPLWVVLIVIGVFVNVFSNKS